MMQTPLLAHDENAAASRPRPCAAAALYACLQRELTAAEHRVCHALHYILGPVSHAKQDVNALRDEHVLMVLVQRVHAGRPQHDHTQLQHRRITFWACGAWNR